MIKRIKIFGERNSGTNFINKLIKTNIKGVPIMGNSKWVGDYKDGTGWKHGTPNLELYNKMDDILFVFIIRDLNSWLKSMYVTPYHLDTIKDVNMFLTKKIVANEKRWRDHPVYVDIEETHKTIMELRYYKINSYINACKNIKNAIIVNLEDLQQDRGITFINTLNRIYNLKKTSMFNPVKRHTKLNKKIQNRTISITLNDRIINNQKNIELENFVESLKYKYYLKS